MMEIQQTPKNKFRIFERKNRKSMKKFLLTVLVVLVLKGIGCGGSNEAIIPTTELTDEQKAAVKAEDAAIEDEESQGSNKKKKEFWVRPMVVSDTQTAMGFFYWMRFYASKFVFRISVVRIHGLL